MRSTTMNGVSKKLSALVVVLGALSALVGCGSSHEPSPAPHEEAHTEVACRNGTTGCVDPLENVTVCVDLSASSQHCGRCDVRCPTSTYCRSGACVGRE
jgi:hypothetical protein